jgi:hypothetical protein
MGWDCGGFSRSVQTAWVPFDDYGLYDLYTQHPFPNAVSTVAG